MKCRKIWQRKEFDLCNNRNKNSNIHKTLGAKKTENRIPTFNITQCIWRWVFPRLKNEARNQHWNYLIDLKLEFLPLMMQCIVYENGKEIRKFSTSKFKQNVKMRVYEISSNAEKWKCAKLSLSAKKQTLNEIVDTSFFWKSLQTPIKS